MPAPLYHLPVLEVRVGDNTNSNVRVGGYANFRVRVGSARLFTRTPNARDFALQWNIGFSLNTSNNAISDDKYTWYLKLISFPYSILTRSIVI